MKPQIEQGLADAARLVSWLRGHAGVIEDIAAAIVKAIQGGCRVYIFGNGGSAADAQHIAAELVGRFRRERRALPAMALTTDTSTLLSVGNDYGFGHVFTRQVEALVEPRDVVWALSTSGNSANVIEAVHLARERGAVVIGFTGRGGGKLRPLCEHCLCVDHDMSDRIQEIHQMAYHIICQLVEDAFAKEC